MHHTTRTTRHPVRLASPSPLAVSAFCSLACVAGAGAQDLLAPPPVAFSANPQNQPQGWPRKLGVAPSFLVPEVPAPPPPLFQYGPVEVRPHLLYRFSYGDGLLAAPGQAIKTIINEVHPGVLFDLGPHWLLDYTATLRYYTPTYTPPLLKYSTNGFRDSLDHSASLTGAVTNQSSIFGFSQRYFSTSTPLVETGEQTGTENYSTALNVTHQLTARTSLELAFNQDFRLIDYSYSYVAAERPLQDSSQWSTLDWLNHQFQPRFGAALGVGGGYVALSASPDMTFEQIQGRVNWRPTDKLTLVVSGGLDERQFLTNAPNLLSPTFAASLIFKPSESTTLSFTADRSIVPSIISGLIVEDTELTGSLDQRLFKRLLLGVRGGYRSMSYDATFNRLSLYREDHITFVHVRLGMTLFKERGTAGIFFQTTDDSSTSNLYTLSSTQVGFDLGYKF